MKFSKRNFQTLIYLLQIFLNPSKEHACAHFISTYAKTETIQGRLLWPLWKAEM